MPQKKTPPTAEFKLTPPPSGEHAHAHSHTQTKQVLKRINNIVGHMQGIGNMVEEGRDCSEVLIQLSAVNAALKKLKTIILKDHVEHCLIHAIEDGDQATLDKLNDALDKLID